MEKGLSARALQALAAPGPNRSIKVCYKLAQDGEPIVLRVGYPAPVIAYFFSNYPLDHGAAAGNVNIADPKVTRPHVVKIAEPKSTASENGKVADSKLTAPTCVAAADHHSIASDITKMADPKSTASNGVEAVDPRATTSDNANGEHAASVEDKAKAQGNNGANEGAETVVSPKVKKGEAVRKYEENTGKTDTNGFVALSASTEANGNAKSFRIRGTAAVGNHPWSLEINSVLRPTPHIQLLVGKLDDITILKILGLILALLLTIGQNVVQGYCPAGKPIKTLPEVVELGPNATTADLYEKLSKQTRFSVHQLRVTKGSDGTVISNAKDASVYSTGLRDQSTIYVKDLGTQIGWRTVFIVEYLGPIIIHPLIYSLRPFIYPSATKTASQLQTISLWLVVLHFVKRELETLFVHRFSAATMPLRNIFKNSFHYWALSGLLIAAFIYSPSSSTAREPNPLLLYPGLVLYSLGELGNLQTHLTLKGLRSAGGKERGIPQGALFNLVTCPNYLTETISWIGVYLVSGLSWGVLIFLVISVAQMAQWAKKKERRYRKEFGDKYKKKRFSMLPGIW